MLTLAAFAELSDLVRRRSGIELTPDKLALVKSRLAPVARLFGFRGVAALMKEFPNPPEELAAAVTEAMTTNETSFFRDRDLFLYFRNVTLPALCKAHDSERRLRIWCAAASTGQEAYSLAIMLAEANLAGWKIDLIATDISARVIGRAKEGLYSQFEVQRGLSTQTLVTHFAQEGNQWRVSERLRRAISFRTFNLLDDFGWLGRIDVVFCRNVLLYFDPHVKAAVFAKLGRCLAPGGTLMLGASESGISPFAAAEAPRGVFIRPRGATLRMALAG